MDIAMRLRPAVIMLLAVAAALLATAILAFGGTNTGGGTSTRNTGTGNTGAAPGSGVIDVVAAENQYGNVVAQVGGPYVHVTSLLSNPSTDPHTFEASVAVAREVGQARLVVQNGLGYDSFADSIENAAPDPGRTVIDAARLLGLPGSTPNPHLWYDPATMPKVAAAAAAALSRVEPSHAAYFRENARKFTGSLGAWNSALQRFAAVHKNVPVASTEPVADYLLDAAGARNLTPWSFQAAVMNGTDPSPQDVAATRALLSQRRVRALVCNEQVTDPLTASLVALAGQNGIPVVGVYETMPEPGYDYQSWMLTETSALSSAVQKTKAAERS